MPACRFDLKVMQLAQFAWVWVAAATPDCIIPLNTLAADAWDQTIEARLGLFSGPQAS